MKEVKDAGGDGEQGVKPLLLEKLQDAPRIDNPWHSRVLDVHRWSDHPEIIKIVEQIWSEHFADFAGDGRSGPKPKLSFKHQLRVLLLDLYVAWLEDPTLCVGVSMSENDWHTWSRYNALSISKKIIPLIHRLNEVGLIDLAKGSYSGPWAVGNRTTRIRAGERLREIFQAAKWRRDDVRQVEAQECIVLKSGDQDEAKLVEYEDDEVTNQMRADLQAYNVLLAGTFIDLPALEDPWINRLDGRGQEIRVHIDPHHQFVRRIFSRGTWTANGRFYGPWWQQIGSEWRRQIFINDTPTVEVDFKGLHVSILSVEQGVEVGGDPYLLDDGLIPGAPPGLQRRLVKRLVLTALNARSKRSAFASFRDGFPRGHLGKSLRDKELDDLLMAFTARHPHLADHLCADQGIRLMNVDGQIANLVHQAFTRQRIPVLSVHDSFIIDYTRVAELKRVMQAAAKQVVGRELPVEANGPGLDEMPDDRDIQLDFQAYREAPRCIGYLERLRRWEERRGGVIIPYTR